MIKFAIEHVSFVDEEDSELREGKKTMLEITLNVTGLEGLVAALQGLSISTPAPALVADAVQPLQQPIQAPASQPMAAPQTYQAPQQMTPPVTVPIDQPVHQPVQSPPTLPTTDVSYTNEQLAVAMTSLVDAGKMDAVRALLNRFNAPSLMQLPKEQYGAFANELRQMGAKL